MNICQGWIFFRGDSISGVNFFSTSSPTHPFNLSPCQSVLHSNVSTVNWSIIESDMPSALGLVHFLYFPKMSNSRPNLSDLCPWLHHTAHWLRTRVTTKTQISFQFFFQNQALIANSLPNFTRSCVRCPQAWHRFWMTSWQWPTKNVQSASKTVCYIGCYNRNTHTDKLYGN